MNGGDLSVDLSAQRKGTIMQRTIIVITVLLGAVLSAHAATPTPKHHKSVASSSGAVTYNRDSRDPNVGWHWEGGMRVCHNDCDNPEIPGSGYTCYNVQALGMPMRECDNSN
jgi:hypothetical protein